MKTLNLLLLLPLFSLLGLASSQAQTVAGTLPSGAILQSPGLNLIVDTLN